MNRRWLVLALGLGVAGAAQAATLRSILTREYGPMHTLITREKMLPERYQWEVGGAFQYRETNVDTFEFEDEDAAFYSVEPYGRYGVTDKFAVNLALPLRSTDREVGDEGTGLGDFHFGFDCVAYENATGYPYVMPYLDIGLPTGDDDDGLGDGSMWMTFGTVLGSTILDDWHFAVDARYTMRDGANILGLGGSIVWDLSEQFSFVAEGLYADTDEEEDFDEDFNPWMDQKMALAGMAYTPAVNWFVGVYGGALLEDDDTFIAAVKFGYIIE